MHIENVVQLPDSLLNGRLRPKHLALTWCVACERYRLSAGFMAVPKHLQVFKDEAMCSECVHDSAVEPDSVMDICPCSPCRRRRARKAKGGARS